MSDTWSFFLKNLSCYRYEINGHPTDFARSGRYLTEMVKSQYPINLVPANIALALKELELCLAIAENNYEQTVDLIITEVKKQNCLDQVPSKIFEEE